MASQTNPQVLDISVHDFVVPTKKLCRHEDMLGWESSQAYSDVVGFICAMNDAVRNKKLTDECNVSENMQKLIDMLGILNSWIDEFPPIDQPQRFGNKAFKSFHEKLLNQSKNLLTETMDASCHRSIPELCAYLCDAFGNSTRIDYGTGHELAFVAFICCLYKIGMLGENDATATVLKLFNAYLNLCRRLQQVYRMEPAGSHGVWSLDDYQFIPFIWGSSQLMDHKRITPNKFVEEDYYKTFHKDFMFLGCIHYICSVKTGPFAEHSNQLWNISGVPLWSKVNSGLLKMYKAEVLAKFPVVQHFLFGSLLTLKPDASSK